MNKRYKELEKQCTEQLIDYDVGKRYDQVDHRKLAELIILECTNFLKDTLDDHFAAEQLKEHFGVEL